MVMTESVKECEIKGTKVQKNLNISRALFNVMFDALRDCFGDREVMTRGDLERVEKKLDASWFHVESLFDNTCAQCSDIPWYVRDERRKDAITRLVYASLRMNIEKRSVPSWVVFPRVVVSGLQTMVAVMLTNREWRLLNDHARFIFEYIGSDDDTVLATQLKNNPAILLLSQRVFLTLLLRFKGFNARRQEFISIINNSTAETGYRMTDMEFCEVFEALFRDYHDMIQNEDGRARLAISHSDDFPERIKGIFDAFYRFKTGAAFVSKFQVSSKVK